MTFSELCAIGKPALFTAAWHGDTVFTLYGAYQPSDGTTKFYGGAGGKLYGDFDPSEVVTKVATSVTLTP